MERKNYYALDIAKFISAFLVICIHCGPLLDVSETGNFVLVQIIARLAVPFFFVASGFLLFQKIDLQREWNDYENKAKLKHYVGRLCKIYLIWTILYLPFNYLLVSENGISLMEILRYLRDFFFTGSYYHLWFLPALIVAVVIVYGLLFLVGLQKTIWISFILYLLGMAGNVYADFILQLPLMGKLLDIYLKVFSTTRNGLFFGVLFVVIGAVFAKRNFYFKNRYVVLGGLTSIILLFVECFLLREYGFMNDLTSMYLMNIPCMFFIFLFLLRLNLKKHKIYKTLRVMSLLIYVMHVMVINVVVKVAPTMHSLAAYGIVVFVTVLLSLLLYLISKKVRIVRHLYA